MDAIQIILGIFLAYLIGSVHTGILFSRLVYGIDPREHGDGLASNLNIQHIMGWRFGLWVRLFDVVKGFLATRLAILIYQQGIYNEQEYPLLMLSFGLAAILGHIFPVFWGFKGGKGLHCAIGVMLALNPIATLICISIGLLIFFLSRYANLGYVVGSAALPAFTLIFKWEHGDFMPTLIFSISIFLILFFSHFDKLKRILNGKEIKVAVLHRKKRS